MDAYSLAFPFLGATIGGGSARIAAYPKQFIQGCSSILVFASCADLTVMPAVRTELHFKEDESVCHTHVYVLCTSKKLPF